MSDIIDDKTTKSFNASRNSCNVCGHEQALHDDGSCRKQGCKCDGIFV